MSFEGYFQLWCHNGHYWEGNYDYGTGGVYEDDALCPCCGGKIEFSNRVDDTNCDSYGEIILKPTGLYDLRYGEIEPIYKIPEIKFIEFDKNTGEPIYGYETKDGIEYIRYYK